MTNFSVVTPSFQQADWLRLAIRSVADQGVPVEHIVQDAGSSDDTVKVLAEHPAVRAFIERDAGMYDALNRGFARATGEIFSYLNCDEQYLPGALAQVGDFFEKHPDVDLLFCGMVVVDATGNYVCSRPVLTPLAAHTRVCHLSTFSCAMFFRRRLWERGLAFDSSWKAAGDAEWVLRCLEQGVRMAALRDWTSAFVDTGRNFGMSEVGVTERNRLRDSAPAWQRSAVSLIAAHHRLRRWLAGVYRQQSFDYAIYAPLEPDRRKTFSVTRPTTIWKNRFTLLR